MKEIRIKHNKKNWSVQINGVDITTNSVDIRTKCWTSKTDEIICSPDTLVTEDDSIVLKDNNDTVNFMDLFKKEVYDNEEFDLVSISWCNEKEMWKAIIKGEDRYYDSIKIVCDSWTSDISPEICCRPKFYGLLTENEKNKLILE
jgi:hypothetical protein